jgi:hypothetical protein
LVFPITFTYHICFFSHLIYTLHFAGLCG